VHGAEAGGGKRVTARVVLADDVVDLRDMMRMALEMTGDFTVVAEAGDGEAAVRAVREHQPDALLLDLSMPLLGGLDALPEIRRLAPSCSIVVFSGYGDGGLRENALRKGADAFLVKGMLPRDVIGTLRTHLARRRDNGSGGGNPGVTKVT
jgi:DNA-binding NarL/FixJ family response regulator